MFGRLIFLTFPFARHTPKLIAVDEHLEKLLILQERDMRRLQIESQMAQIPAESASLQQDIENEQEALENERKAILHLEVRRKELDDSVQAAESKINQYKNQQLQVKKNEEYQALTHEIERAADKISELEESEIGLMLEIDEQQAAFAERKSASAKKIQLLQSRIAELKQHSSRLENDIDRVRAEVAAARSEVDPAYLHAYEHAQGRAKRAPFVVPLVDTKCSGCHLKVPNEIESDVRRAKQPVHCNSCGRVLYWP